MLRPVHGVFDQVDYPDLLVGLYDPNDAAAWKINANQAPLITTDFFTPVVDEPTDYGAIDAANSVSDIYAMGGVPFLALNIAAMPPDLPPEFLGEIFRGRAHDNRLYFEPHVRFERQLKDQYKLLLYDPQTSAGLLLCVNPDRLDDLIDESSKQNQPIWQIGGVVEASGLLIV